MMVIETERLLLRELTHEDFPTLFEIFQCMLFSANAIQYCCIDNRSFCWGSIV